MGIPKFFRYISERYPLTSELITPKSIPIFDNLYLDMNGIIHNCTHPPSSEGDASFRMTEEQMVLAIFAYIDHLFSKIKPRKVFFMAVDGVAPRAKMNQQRSRRFRTAQEAKELEEKARRKGEETPETAAFDSNCITPGTPFMTRLSRHLQYFVNKKIQEDAEWRGVEVILSGHDVPGEGEHKIQEYIRLSKAQPNYNPNTRHCLYGLDADLIMLGLLSHDPHFCLLREEVTFGRKSRKGTGGLDAQNFYLMHLSLLREYLDLEFSSLSSELPFPYNLESVIDDFILISVFVGNDFLPHLPNLHINEGAMETIWGIYKRVLPGAGGYMNENGKINVARLQLVLNELGEFEREIFERDFSTGTGKSLEAAKNRGKLTVTKPQKDVFHKIKSFVLAHPKPTQLDRLVLSQSSFTTEKDRRILQSIAEDCHLDLSFDELDDANLPIVVVTFKAASLEGVSDEDESGEDEGEEGTEALKRVLKKWEKAKVVEETEENVEAAYETKLTAELEEWKRGYYQEKLEFKYKEGTDEVHDLAYRYIEGLQWVMYYYYAGVASWGWFYDYHYAPRISDLRGVDKMEFNFELGKPFKPFEQLMGVLPEASSSHIPVAFRDLMSDPNSTILDFYPEEFEADMNGKKQEWEAVVKIPFIDESRLLKAMAAREHRLDPEERARNTNGHAFRFIYDEDLETFFPSPIPGLFPDIIHGHTSTSPFIMPSLDGLELIQGLLSGVHLGASALAGFPSMQTLPHTAQLGYHGVNVHMSDSKNPSMVITVENTYEGKKTESIAEELIGKKTFTGWPFLREGMVVGVSDDMFKFGQVALGGKKKVVSSPHSPMDVGNWKKKVDKIEHHYSKRFGVIIGQVDVLLHVRPLKGLKRLDSGAFIKEYEGPEKEVEQAVQVSVSSVEFEDERYLEQVAPKLSEEFPEGEKVFFLGEHLYGSAAQVVSTTETQIQATLAYWNNEARENAAFTKVVATRPAGNYFAAYELTRRLGMSGLALSRITSSFMVATSDGNKTNLGLSLKFEGKGLKVMGYSRKLDRGWEFSEKAVELIRAYKNAFPDVFQNLDVRNDNVLRAQQLLTEASLEEADARVHEAKKWLAEQGVRDFEPVSLFAEQLGKETVQSIEKLADTIHRSRSSDQIKKALIKGLPRQAVLKPSHAIYRLQAQIFALGDRVIMVQDSGAGGVPFSLKGVVIGLNSATIDVVWDSAFIAGGTLGGRCTEYRGASIPFSSCLNLTHRQYTAQTKPDSSNVPAANGASAAQRPHQGHPLAAPGRAPAAGMFKPTPHPNAGQPPVQLLQRGPSRPANANQGSFGQVAQGFKPPPVAPAQAHLNNLQQALRPGPPAGRGGRPFAPPAMMNGRGRGGVGHLPFAPPHIQQQQQTTQQVPPPFAPRGGFRGRGARGGRGRGGAAPSS